LLNAQIAQERSRVEVERSTQSALQQQMSELEKEKKLIDLELKETSTRHKTELGRRDATISNVCGPLNIKFVLVLLNTYLVILCKFILHFHMWL